MLIKASRNPQIWVMCCSICMTNETVTSESTEVYAVACKNKKVCLKVLNNAIRETVEDNYKGCDEPEVEETIESDIEEIMSSAEHIGKNILRYTYSATDREAVWKIYPMRVYG